MNSMKNFGSIGLKRIIIPFLIIVIGILLTVIFFYIPYYPAAEIKRPKPESKTSNKKILTEAELREIKTATDKYMSNMVGLSEFQKNYRFRENYTCYGPESRWNVCWIHYIFLPGKKYKDYSDVILDYDGYMITIYNSGNIYDDYETMSAPSCERDINNCDFKLSLSDLQAIANKENFHPLTYDKLRLVMKNNEIVAEFSSCGYNLDDGKQRRIQVDLQDGTIIGRGPNNRCIEV